MSVFSSKLCLKEITCPVHGQVGFRRNSGVPGGLEQLVYDKGGLERAPRDGHGKGGKITESDAGWVTPAEHKRRKEARSRHWQKTKGPDYHKATSRRRSSFEMRGGVDALYYDGGHPHDGVSFVVKAREAA